MFYHQMLEGTFRSLCNDLHCRMMVDVEMTDDSLTGASKDSAEKDGPNVSAHANEELG